MNSKIDSLKTDPKGVCFKVYDNSYLKLDKFFSTIKMRVILRLRGIMYGRGTHFYGKSIFRRCIGSQIKIGDNCRFRSSFLSNNVGLNRKCFFSTLRAGATLQIGNNVGMSAAVIGCAQRITIGNNVLIGGNTFITDFDWHTIDSNTDLAKPAPVIIEDDVFIGFNVTILKGVKIGKGSVIGANSVVANDIPAGCIAVGNPCKPKRGK